MYTSFSIIGSSRTETEVYNGPSCGLCQVSDGCKGTLGTLGLSRDGTFEKTSLHSFRYQYFSLLRNKVCGGLTTMFAKKKWYASGVEVNCLTLITCLGGTGDPVRVSGTMLHSIHTQKRMS